MTGVQTCALPICWETILKKREGYRAAFADFDPWQILTFDQAHVERLLQDPSIIRNRLKVQGAVRNAARFVEVQREFGSFDAYIWSFVGGTTIDRAWATRADVPSTSPESDRLGQDLRKRGFTFVGSKIVYSEMQAAGLVNDHTLDCFRHDELK